MYFVFYFRILYNRIIYDTLTFTIHINDNIFDAGFLIQFIIKLSAGSVIKYLSMLYGWRWPYKILIFSLFQPACADSESKVKDDFVSSEDTTFRCWFCSTGVNLDSS